MDPLRRRGSESSEPDENMAAFRSRRWEPEEDHAPWFVAIGVAAGALGLAWLSLRPTGRPWESVDALLRVQGIGPKRLESMRPFLTIAEETHKRDK
jgi:type II secretory pathway component PulK